VQLYANFMQKQDIYVYIGCVVKKLCSYTVVAFKHRVYHRLYLGSF
jgi:hypothetical protein